MMKSPTTNGLSSTMDREASRIARIALRLPLSALGRAAAILGTVVAAHAAAPRHAALRGANVVQAASVLAAHAARMLPAVAAAFPMLALALAFVV
jgi:hypothetical protein